jgi:hypothetical protein
MEMISLRHSRARLMFLTGAESTQVDCPSFVFKEKKKKKKKKKIEKN